MLCATVLRKKTAFFCTNTWHIASFSSPWAHKRNFYACISLLAHIWLFLLPVTLKQ